MAGFRKDKTTAAQTAANVAGGVTAALVATGEVGRKQAPEAVVEIFEALFDVMSPVVDADNALFAEVDAQDGAPAAKPAARTRKTGGGGSRSNGKISLQDALSLELKGRGIFAGETLETVLNLTAEEADEQFGYGDGEASGRDYIAWLASDRNKNDFTRDRAKVIADAEGISY